MAMADRQPFVSKDKRPKIGPTIGRFAPIRATQYVHCRIRISCDLYLCTDNNPLANNCMVIGPSCSSKTISSSPPSCLICHSFQSPHPHHNTRCFLGHASIHHAIQLNSNSHTKFDIIWICFSVSLSYR